MNNKKIVLEFDGAKKCETGSHIKIMLPNSSSFVFPTQMGKVSEFYELETKLLKIPKFIFGKNGVAVCVIFSLVELIYEILRFFYHCDRLYQGIIFLCVSIIYSLIIRVRNKKKEITGNSRSYVLKSDVEKQLEEKFGSRPEKIIYGAEGERITLNFSKGKTEIEDTIGADGAAKIINAVIEDTGDVRNRILSQLSMLPKYVLDNIIEEEVERINRDARIN